MTRRAALLLCAAFALAGCRTVAVQSGEPGRNYSIEISNDSGVGIVVSYNDGRGDAVLGTVAANRSERFIIASPANTSITVRGVATSGSRTFGPYTVSLTAGATQQLRIR